METSGYSNTVPGADPGDTPTESTVPAPQPDYGFFAPAPAVTPTAEAPVEQPVEPVAPAESVVPAEPEPVVQAEPEPVVEAPAEPVVQAESEPVVQAESEPVVQAEPEPVVEPAPVVAAPLLVDETAPESAASLVGSPVEGLPMSLAIAAQEAAEVDLSQPVEPPSVDYSAFNGLGETDAPQSAPVDAAPAPAHAVPFEYPAEPVDAPASTFEAGYESGYDAAVLEEEAGVGLAASEAEESSYHRMSTEASASDDVVLVDLLLEVLERRASDLHLSAGARPTIRVNGELEQLDDQPVLTPPVIQRVMYASITQRQREKFEENLELDFAYSVPGRARFRVNMYRQRDAVGAAFRLIPFEIKKLEDLGVPPQVANFSMLPRGFVLVTGPTGSGKSTTLASLLDLANRNRKDHIMTVEDPIEFLHRHLSCLVNQREVGEDTWSFQNALKHVLRQDPDIILVGEMRDLETISVALTAAETGHLVYATLHTQDAAQTIDRVIDVFPPHQQQQIRAQLATSIQGVVCQTLARTPDGKGRVVACEVMVATPAIRNLIREGKTHQIYSVLQTGSATGMQTMDTSLASLVRSGKISTKLAEARSSTPEELRRLLGSGSLQAA